MTELTPQQRWQEARAALEQFWSVTAQVHSLALLVILDLHQPHPKDSDVCEHCSFIPEDVDNPDDYGPEAYNETRWPCRSAQIVLDSVAP